MTAASNITIIIPTYSRPYFLKRAVSFWSKCHCRVIIVDGSDMPNEDMSRYENSGIIRYFHSPIPIVDRILFATSKVDTDFVAIIPDDEFYLPSALEDARNILESRPDVSFVAGATIGFISVDNEFVVKHQYKGNFKLKINSDLPFTRLEQRFGDTDSSIYYGLRRLKDFKKISGLIAENKYSCPYVQEIQVEIATLLQGKVEFIKKLMWLRCNEAAPISRKGFDRSKSLSDWFSDSEMEVEHDLFYRSLTDFISRCDTQDLALNYVMDLYISREKKHCNTGGFSGETLLDKIKRSLGEISNHIKDKEYCMGLLMAFQRAYSLVFYNNKRRGYSPLWLTLFEMRYCFGISIDQRELHHAIKTVEASSLPLEVK